MAEPFHPKGVFMKIMTSGGTRIVGEFLAGTGKNAGTAFAKTKGYM